jgi:hypothetical protein
MVKPGSDRIRSACSAQDNKCSPAHSDSAACDIHMPWSGLYSGSGDVEDDRLIPRVRRICHRIGISAQSSHR